MDVDDATERRNGHGRLNGQGDGVGVAGRVRARRGGRGCSAWGGRPGAACDGSDAGADRREAGTYRERAQAVVLPPLCRATAEGSGDCRARSVEERDPGGWERQGDRGRSRDPEPRATDEGEGG